MFAGLAPADQVRVAALARPTRLSAGERAWSADGTARLTIAHSGRLKIVRTAADGSQQVVRVLGPGEFTGEESVFTGRASDDEITALDDARLCVFRHEDLRALLVAHPEIAWPMLAAVSSRLADAEDRLRALASKDVESRLADYLLGLPAAWDPQGGTVTLPLAKQDVAALLDTSPESLSRALRQLSARGLITVGPRRSVTITAPDGLQRLVDGT